jgi:galactoside 2-L-fucosyltransferase 1/2
MWNTLLSRRSELLAEFQWNPDLKASVNDYITELTTGRNTSTLIGVHVRMTDYYAHLNIHNRKVTAPGTKYFNTSMNYFRRKYDKPTFLVVSNDMQWCREHISGNDIIYAGIRTMWVIQGKTTRELF